VADLGLEDNVFFHNRYTSLPELCEYLMAADLYVTPYWAREQIVSGTLSYALACGKAIISTPYWYAEELLADGRGLLTPFGDADAMAEQLRSLLRDDAARNQMRKRAYLYGRQMIWSEVAQAYGALFDTSITGYADMTPALAGRARLALRGKLPPVNLDHLRVMTDGTGMLQHAIFATPDRNHGYCIDDNARALIAVLQHWQLTQDARVLPLYQTYMSFIHHAFNEERGAFRNFMAYDRSWLEEIGSEDSQGRTIWALGTAVAFAPNSASLGLACTLFQRALPLADRLEAARAQAFTLLGLHAYLRRFSGASEVRRLRERLALQLYAHFEQYADQEWPWFEEVATYCNARVPQALIMSGHWLEHQGMVTQGLRSLEWLFERQTNPATGNLSIIGNDGWLCREDCARFDQQPVEAGALLDAAGEAYGLTGDERWRARMHQCLGWFLGRNDLREPLVDAETGGCRDGLRNTSANANQGAESTLAWLMALQTMHLAQHEQALQVDTTPDLLLPDETPLERSIGERVVRERQQAVGD
jgi:hypothetical protein